jgi:DNA repair exonuclease SbcCD ATPase subunit
MILRHLRVERFRALQAFEAEFSPGLNVVYGPNEAGKSTLQAAIVAVLFTDPGRRNQKIDGMRSWGTEALPVLTASFTPNGGSSEPLVLTKDFEAKRAQLQRPGLEALTDRGRIAQELETLTGLSDEAVYLDTACLLQQQWARVTAGEQLQEALQQTLTGGPAGTGVQEIIRKLDAAIKALERGVNRPAPVNPSPLAQVIAEREARERQLLQARAEAADFDAARTALDEAQQQIASMDVELSQAQALAASAARALELERKAGELAERLDDLANRLELVEKLDREATALEQGLAEQTPVDLNTAAEVTGWTDRMREREKEQGTLREQVATDEQRIARLQADLKDAAAQAALQDVLSRVAQLQAQAETDARTAAELRQQADDLAARTAQARAQSRRAHILAVAGALAVVAGGLAGLKFAALFALAAVGAVLLAVAWGARPSERWQDLDARRAQAQDDAARAGAAASERAAEPAALLQSCGCASIEELRERIATGEARARALQAELDEARGALATRNAQLTQVGDVIRALHARLTETLRRTGLDSPEALVEQARARDSAQKQLRERRAKRDGALGGETVEQLEARRRDLSRDWRSLRDELDSPELSMARLSPQDYQALRSRVDDLRLRREEQARVAAEAERRILASRADPDLVRALEGQVQSLAEREQLLRDRLTTWQIAKEVIDQASTEALSAATEFLGPRMGELLARLTGQRYGEVILGPNLDPALVMPQTGQTVQLSVRNSDPLSVAAREQVFLAARLALVDMLWPHGGPPLLLDDPLVNFDAERRAAALQAICEVSKTHQAILFTCGHDYDAVADRLIPMPGPK